MDFNQDEERALLLRYTSATGPAAHGAGELDSTLMTRPALTLGSPLVRPGCGLVRPPGAPKLRKLTTRHSGMTLSGPKYDDPAAGLIVAGFRPGKRGGQCAYLAHDAFR
jgi:hypothetical protein